MERAGEEEEQLPPGFRFHPTDEELVAYYLRNKITEANFGARAIAEVDLNKCEPWDLPGKAKMGEKEWYFFSLRDRKYPTGVRTNRATDAGYWKTTGKDKEIFSAANRDLVGMKKTLVFYRGRAPKGQKTNWIMHEYRLPSKYAFKFIKDEWVVSRVFMKSSAGCSKKHRDDLYGLEVSPQVLPAFLDLDSFGVVAPAELAELPRLAGCAHGLSQMLRQSHLSFPSGSFCFATPPPPPPLPPPCLPPPPLETDYSMTELENFWNWKRCF